MNPLELIRFVEAHIPENEQLNALALLGDPPNEEFIAKTRLPVQNEIPGFKLGEDSLGAILAGMDYGMAAPVIGQSMPEADQSIGELLTGEINAT